MFAQGAGVIQVENSYEYLMKFPIINDVRYDVTQAGNRGIYLRDYEDSRKILETAVTVKTVFHENTENSVKIQHEKRISLHSSQSWITVPKFLASANEGKKYPKIPEIEKIKNYSNTKYKKIS